MGGQGGHTKEKRGPGIDSEHFYHELDLWHSVGAIDSFQKKCL